MQGISCSLLNGSICRKAGCRYSQVAPMAGFECRTVDAVYFVASKKPWIPQTKIVEGKKFICISKWDAGFVKFATGKSMERRASKPNNTGNFDILDEIKRLRLESCNAKVQSLIAEASVDLPEEPKAKKQKQQHKARDSDYVIGGTWISVALPPKDGVPGHTMDVLWSVTSPVVWMEYTIENLQYLKTIVQSPDASKGRARPAKGQGTKAKKRKVPEQAAELAAHAEPAEVPEAPVVHSEESELAQPMNAAL